MKQKGAHEKSYDVPYRRTGGLFCESAERRADSRDSGGCAGKEEIPGCIIGNGSNLLVSDDGYRGVIIQLYRNMRWIVAEGTRIRAQAGGSLSQIGNRALELGLTGMEFAAGIPGTAG